MDKEKKYVFYTLSSSEDVDNIRYVGVTTRLLSQRLSQHKYVAKKSEKRSTPVSKWIYSLQLKNLDVIITKIDECDKDNWEEKEISLISKYKLNYDLLNIDKGGKGIITIEKRNKSGLIRSSESHEIKVVQLNLNGEYVQTFASTIKAAKAMGLSAHSAISNVLKGRSKTSCNSYWVYEKDYLTKSFDLKKPITPKESKGFKHYQYSPDTLELINTYQSIAEVFYAITGSKKSNSEGLTKAVINKVIWHDFFWATKEVCDFTEYFDDRFKIHEVNNLGEIINKFKNNSEAAKHFNLANSTISNYIRYKTITKNNTYLIKNNKQIKI